MFRQVNKEEFWEFIEAYPDELTSSITGIREPPMQTFNDFSDGKVWPESIVAKISMDWMGENGGIDHKTDKYWEYYIKGEDR